MVGFESCFQIFFLEPYSKLLEPAHDKDRLSANIMPLLSTLDILMSDFFCHSHACHVAVSSIHLASHFDDVNMRTE